MGFWEQFILCNHETYVILETKFFFLFFFELALPSKLMEFWEQSIFLFFKLAIPIKQM